MRISSGTGCGVIQTSFQWPGCGCWLPVRDGNDSARNLFDRHYSRYRYKDGRRPKLFVGPGEKLVLLTPCGTALFVWRKFRSADLQYGVNCAVFRNEGHALKASQLILLAEEEAYRKWGPQRLFTYVNSRRIKSKNPGFCFIKAGWTRCGVTKTRQYLILEKLPLLRACEVTNDR